MNIADLANIKVDPHAKASVNYVRFRSAIEELAKNRAQKRECKQLVIQELHGVVQTQVGAKRGPGSLLSHKIVVFPDNSKAKW